MSRKPKFQPVPSTCSGCGKPAGIQSYMTALPGRPPLIRPARSCYGCRVEREARTVLQTWDWASALLKETRMHVQKTRDGVWSGQMTPAVIRALLTAQQGRCVVTQQVLWLPQLPISPHSTLTGSLAEYPCGPERDQAPQLVRALLADPEWTPGNICLVACCWKAPYYQLGGAAELVRFMRTQPTPQIPTDSLLRHIASEDGKRQIEEWIRYRTEQVKEST